MISVYVMCVQVCAYVGGVCVKCICDVCAGVHVCGVCVKCMCAVCAGVRVCGVCVGVCA